MNTIGLYTLTRREIERFFRVAIQSLISPWVSATLFILVFGKIVGARIGVIEGIPYITFVLPGILMMNVTMSAFMQTSSSLYFQRFLHHIE
ncbi:ABC transporter permease, partial [Patescibacteria group bacterium]|nr:ABC transporter permease [Patescibacteria group bacterium]